VATRWTDPAAFRADPSAAPAARPTPRQTVALLAVLLLVAGAVAAAAYLIRPDRARAFDLLHGSVFIEDQAGPVAVDLANAKPTFRLLGAEKLVSVKSAGDLSLVPLDGGTLLLNSSSGEFNLIDNTGFAVKHDGSGVQFGRPPASPSAVGFASGKFAYVERTGGGSTDVYLVSKVTVQSAVTSPKTVKARAGITIKDAGTTAPGGAAAANGDLWLLLGAGPNRSIRQLRVPSNSEAGVALTSTAQGSVVGPAAIGTATTDNAGDAVVAVASSNRIQLFPNGTAGRSARFTPLRGVDSILPASNAQGRISFLIHSADGWSVVSVATNGTQLRGPTLVKGVAPDAKLATPAASQGGLYTMDRATGQIFRIGADAKAATVPAASTYPIVQSVEAEDFLDAYVIAEGPRVIINSPSHSQAIGIFTDGSHGPQVIKKTNATTVNATGGAEAFTKGRVDLGQPGKKPINGGPKPKPTDGQPINNKIDCTTATQKPHIPDIVSAIPGSRTVALQWTYPTISPQDCIPRTYEVSVKLLSSGAPSAPAAVRVESQTGTNLAGLFPSSEYEITVTAYINGQGTASQPTRITTGPEGPAAPTNVQVAADSSGNWNVTWQSCGQVTRGCVEAASWKVIPSFCDGRGLTNPPAPIEVDADPTTRQQPPATYRAGDALLGRGLQFQIEGTGVTGAVGDASVKSACAYSWTPPVAADLSVQASSPPQTTGQDTTSTTATVKFAGGQIHDLGGVGGTLTYQLFSQGTLVQTKGPTTAPSVTLNGIRAGQRYQVSVLASPPRHPDVVVTVGPVNVDPAVAVWPTVFVQTPTFDAPAGLTGTLHVTFTFPDGTATRGETFELINSRLQCGNTATELTRSDVAPGDDMAFAGIDRVTYNGACTVTIQLAQDARTATDPPLYGAGNSDSTTSPSFQVDPPSSTSTSGDFTAQWAGSTGRPQVVVSYHGGDDLSGASNWRMEISNGSSSCGTGNGDPPPTTIDVDKSCIKDGGAFTVDIRYTYFILSQAHFTVDVQGNAPQPVDPSKISFSAAWNDNPNLPQVDVTYTGSEDTASLAPLQWTETVTSSASPGVTCGGPDPDNPGSSSVRIDVDLTVCPPTDANNNAAVYTVEISFTDPNYGQTGDYTYIVQNSPPIP
jgi:hypothetical protein